MEIEMQILDPIYSEKFCDHDIDRMGQAVVKEVFNGKGELVRRELYCPNCDKFLKVLMKKTEQLKQQILEEDECICICHEKIAIRRPMYLGACKHCMEAKEVQDET